MVYRKAEHWSSRISVILAVIGSAVGLGNFLRFPSQLALYGGAYLIPYFCALVLLGLPLMWLEWALGRYGGIWGRHSLPGIYDQVTRRPWGKYLGVLGLYLPFIIVVYYLYVESWTLGYTFFSALGELTEGSKRAGLSYLNHFLGDGGTGVVLPVIALIVLAITLAINFYVVYRGVEAGIEKLNMLAMPLLFLVAGGLMLFVLTMPGINHALNYYWAPDLSKLHEPGIWLAAAGQVFFSLSLALGAVISYTSYLRKDDDVALGGLTAVSVNTFAEVIIGASIVAPVAFLLMGPAITQAVEHTPFTLPFLALPLLFQQVPLGKTVGALWFLLLFFAGITSSVSLLQPILAFFQDELGWARRKATLVLLGLTVIYLGPVVLLRGHQFLNQMDFWAVQILLPLGALIEVLVFVWVLGIARGWEGITFGAHIRVPRIFKFILTVITPLYLIGMLGWWAWTDAVPELMLLNIPAADQPYVIAARVVMGVVFLAMMLMLRFAWMRRLDADVPEIRVPETIHFEEETGSVS